MQCQILHCLSPTHVHLALSPPNPYHPLAVLFVSANLHTLYEADPEITRRLSQGSKQLPAVGTQGSSQGKFSLYEMWISLYEVCWYPPWVT